MEVTTIARIGTRNNHLHKFEFIIVSIRPIQLSTKHRGRRSSSPHIRICMKFVLTFVVLTVLTSAELQPPKLCTMAPQYDAKSPPRKIPNDADPKTSNTPLTPVPPTRYTMKAFIINKRARPFILSEQANHRILNNDQQRTRTTASRHTRKV